MWNMSDCAYMCHTCCRSLYFVYWEAYFLARMGSLVSLSLILPFLRRYKIVYLKGSAITFNRTSVLLWFPTDIYSLYVGNIDVLSTWTLPTGIRDYSYFLMVWFLASSDRHHICMGIGSGCHISELVIWLHRTRWRLHELTSIYLIREHNENALTYMINTITIKLISSKILTKNHALKIQKSFL